MSDRRVLGLLGLLVAVVTALGIPAHATYGARVAVDEPQYLLTAMSIGDDGDLDISDELADEAYRPFHRVDLPRQTYPVGDSATEISPHDPLLPVLLAVPMRLGGWVAAKAFLALVAGALAALTAWTAIFRFGVSRRVAVGVVAAFSCAAPVATYATQIYPEVLAALAVVAAVAAATAAPGRRSAAVLVVAVVALPWLSIKYAPVAGALAGIALWRWRREPRFTTAMAGVFAVAGATYLLVHRRLYGGWTSYASSGAFADNGELSVVGTEPDYLGRTRRLVGLLVDDGFGLALWMPGWLLAPVAVGVLWRRRPAGAELLLVPLAAGWMVATFVALTMHGWWWPGRQVVVVLPLAVIGTAIAVDVLPFARRMIVPTAMIGIATWVWTTVEAITRRHALVVDFEDTGNPWVQLWRLVLPDGRQPTPTDSVLLVAWTIGVAALAWMGWNYAGTGAPSTGAGEPERSSMSATTVASRSGLRGAKPSSS